MRRLAAGLGYGALALGLHLAAVAALAPALQGMQAAGAGGEDRVTLAPASAQVAALVRDWTRAPAARVDSPQPPAPPRPEADTGAPRPAAPVVEATSRPSRHAPQLQLPPAAAQEPAVAAQAAPPPPVPPKARPRPAAVPHESPPHPAPHRARENRAASPAMRARGQGGGASAGGGGQAGVSTSGDPGAAARLRAWGAEIAARIARQKRYPVAAGGAVGRVGVTLRVTAAGDLADVRIARSSGSPALDRAALEAARRAAPFPPAPGSGAGPFGFSFTMEFRR